MSQKLKTIHRSSLPSKSTKNGTADAKWSTYKKIIASSGNTEKLKHQATFTCKNVAHLKVARLYFYFALLQSMLFLKDH